METESFYKLYSSVEQHKIEWLWYPYIPYGKITLLQGDPGDGKSTFMINVAARLTIGGKMPDGSSIQHPATVIYQCAEDNANDTIKPRLLQAGADCDRIAFIEDKDMNLSLVDKRIEDTIRDLNAKLLILDPLQAFIPADGDMQSASRMRTIMRKLGDVAEKYGCAVVLIGHMNKSSGGKNLYRGLGSIDIAALARSVLMITRDQDHSDIRYMFQIKSNLAADGCAISFTFDDERGFQWIGKCVIHKKDALCIDKLPESKKERAKEYLKIILSAGDVLSTDVLERMEALGIMERTVRSAQKELEIKAYRKHKKWYWHMEFDEE